MLPAARRGVPLKLARPWRTLKRVALVTEDAFDAPTECSICGRPLGENIDDQPYWPTGPMCGECYQSRQLDDEMAWDDE